MAPELDPSVNLRTKVHYVNRIKVKEIIPTDIITILESDFSERARENDLASQEDLRFLSKLKENITQKESGHYEMPLPFKEDQSCQIIRHVRCIVSIVLKGYLKRIKHIIEIMSYS